MIIAGKYLVMEKIGQGAFGEVYKGRTQKDNTQIAIKFVTLFIRLGKTRIKSSTAIS